MPIRNEADFIVNSLSTVLHQSYPSEYMEVLLADGMSEDGTRNIIQQFAQRDSRVHLIDNQEKIVSTGFNRALTKAKGVIIIRVDGHCELSSDYVFTCARLLNSNEFSCVGGSTIHNAEGYIGNIINLAQSSFFGVGGVTFRKPINSGKFVDTLAFGAYERDVFKKIGGYDEELVRNQDDEFNFRLIQNGGKIWLDPSVNSVYYPRSNLGKLFKQYYQYGLYKVRVIQKRSGFASWRHLVPGLFVFSLIMSVLLGIILHNNLIPWIVVGPYMLSNVIASAWSLIKAKRDNQIKQTENQIITHQSKFFHTIYSFFLLMAAFCILHVGYGVGFLLGLIKFWNKWGDRKIRDDHFDKEQFTQTN